MPIPPQRPVNWGSVDNNVMERVMGVMLLREYPEAQRRTPSRGDGGVDVFLPTPGGFHVFQIKGFTGRLADGSRYQQIKKSILQVRNDPRLPARITDLTLVIPVNRTSHEETRISEITRGMPFATHWLGEDFWHSMAAKYPDVIDYYLSDGRLRLEETVRGLQHLLAHPGEHPTIVDVVPQIEGLRSAVNRQSPHFRFEFETSEQVPPLPDLPLLVMQRTQSIGPSGYLTVRVFARYPQAMEDAPVILNITVNLSDPEFKVQFQEFIDYGRELDIPDGALRVAIDAPGGIGGVTESAGGRFGVAAVGAFEGTRLRLAVESPAGDTLAEAVIETERANRGQRGIDLHGRSLDGTFTARFTFDLPAEGFEPRLTVNISGQNPSPPYVSRAVGGARFLGAIAAPNQLVIRPEFGASVMSRTPIPNEEPLVPRELVQYFEDLDVIQQVLDRPILIPDEIDVIEARQARFAARILCGEVVTGSWTELTVELHAGAPAIESPVRFEYESRLTVKIGGESFDLGPMHSLVPTAIPVAERSAGLQVVLTPGPDNRILQRRDRFDPALGGDTEGV